MMQPVIEVVPGNQIESEIKDVIFNFIGQENLYPGQIFVPADMYGSLSAKFINTLGTYIIQIVRDDHSRDITIIGNSGAN